MPLLNYTTTVPVKRTIERITDVLVAAGAKQILTEYGEHGVPTGVVFLADTPLGPRQFVLPVDSWKVKKVLEKEKVPPRFSGIEHAERVAWRILKDWLEAQLAIIKTDMVSLDQVMLPYMKAPDGRTLYDLYRESQLALPSGT
jgi:hypothetical protein